MIAGIDYGAQLAGTTVICFANSGENPQLLRSAKKQNADKMIMDFFISEEVGLIGLDAPLSVPNGILGKGDQFLFRNCDRMLSAMSPMFLGGLTARAMKIKYDLENIKDLRVIEVYPKAFVQKVCPPSLQEIYKLQGEVKNFSTMICREFDFRMNQEINNWHEMDAVLAWLSACRYQQNIHFQFGDEDGMIIV